MKNITWLVPIVVVVLAIPYFFLDLFQDSSRQYVGYVHIQWVTVFDEPSPLRLNQLAAHEGLYGQDHHIGAEVYVPVVSDGGPGRAFGRNGDFEIQLEWDRITGDEAWIFENFVMRSPNRLRADGDQWGIGGTASVRLVGRRFAKKSTTVFVGSSDEQRAALRHAARFYRMRLDDPREAGGGVIDLLPSELRDVP